MPLSQPEQPGDGPEVLRRGLRNIFAASPTRATLDELERTLKTTKAEDPERRASIKSNLDRLRAFSTRPADLEFTSAFPRYEVATLDLRDGRLLEAARLTGWKYFILGDESGPTMATLAAGENKKLDFGRYQRGAVPVSSVEAVRVAENLAESASEDFEVRFLEVPPLNFHAVWLHGSSEWLIPLQTIDPGDGAELTAVQPEVVRRFLVGRLAQGSAVPPPPPAE